MVVITQKSDRYYSTMSAKCNIILLIINIPELHYTVYELLLSPTCLPQLKISPKGKERRRGDKDGRVTAEHSNKSQSVTGFLIAHTLV